MTKVGGRGKAGNGKITDLMVLFSVISAKDDLQFKYQDANCHPFLFLVPYLN